MISYSGKGLFVNTGGTGTEIMKRAMVLGIKVNEEVVPEVGS